MGLLSKLLVPGQVGGTKKSSLVIDGEDVAITLRRNRNARRFILRLDKRGDGVVVTLPTDGSERQAMEFAASNAVWIRRQLSASTDAIQFVDGVVVPLRGVDHRIIHRPDRRGTVWTRDGELPELHVTGQAEHLARRVKDWFKRQAKQDLLDASRRYATVMDLSFARVSVRDQTTRWGSCSSTGTLSYSWRLILAPSFVLDYVAAHEVAHLREMNHSPCFWSLVKSHCAATDEARRWLKLRGRELHRYG